MPKTQGGVVGQGLSDTYVVQFAINTLAVGIDAAADNARTYSNFTTETVCCVGYSHGLATSTTSTNQTVYTVSRPSHLDRIVVCGRLANTSTLATTLLTNPSGRAAYKDLVTGANRHGDAGMDVRVRKAEAATPRTFVNIVDNSIDGSNVQTGIRCPSGPGTARTPFAITYTGIPQVGAGAVGSGWTGTTADDFVVGDKIQIAMDSSDTNQEVDHLFVFAHFSALD